MWFDITRFLYNKIFYKKMSPKNLKTLKNVTSEA